jgi:predicted acylesterase/phospholipase RssA
MYQAVSTLADIMTAQNVKQHLKVSKPDVFLQPEVGSLGLFDFHRLDEGIAIGRKAAQAANKDLQEVAERVQEARGD